MKTFTITIPTTGYEMYEVKANSAAEAHELLATNAGVHGTRIKQIEECAGDWGDEENWEIDEGEEE